MVSNRPHLKNPIETWGPIFLIILTAAVYVGGAGIPALLDDADSFYAEVAREMNLRHDWVTPYANSIRFLEKPPLFYWLISLSYHVFSSENAFTARLPTALAVTALVFVTFKMGKLLFGFRAGLLSGLALGMSVGMFLFTRIILPDALFTLLLTLIFYCFLRWQRAERKTGPLLCIYALAHPHRSAQSGVLLVLLCQRTIVEISGQAIPYGLWDGPARAFLVTAPRVAFPLVSLLVDVVLAE